MKNLGQNVNVGLLILRLSIGGLMLFHGVSKMMHGVGFIEQTVVAAGLPQWVTYGVYIGEVLAPLLILIGWGTRAAAAIFAFNCLAAILLVHAAEIFTLSPHGGWPLELLGLYFFGALVLVFTGGGKYAVSQKHFWD